MPHKYLTIGTDGNQRLLAAAAQSLGEPSAGSIVALDESGKIDETMMPTGIGAPTRAFLTSESLSAGDLVNIHDDEGIMKVRKADATDVGKVAHGFVEEAFASGTTATVYFAGEADQTVPDGVRELFLSKTPGKAGTFDATAAFRQSVGYSTGPNSFAFAAGEIIVL